MTVSKDRGPGILQLTQMVQTRGCFESEVHGNMSMGSVSSPPKVQQGAKEPVMGKEPPILLGGCSFPVRMSCQDHKDP